MEDEELVKHLILKDETVFQEFYDKYYDFIYRICFFMLGNNDDAMDSVQNVFFKIFYKIKSFKFKGRFKNWVGKIAYYEAKNKRRFFSRDKKKSIDFFQEDLKKQRTPEEQLLEKEKIGVLKKAILSLPDKLKIIIVLREIEGLDYEEISSILKIPKGTVKSRIARARIALKEILEGQKVEKM